MLRVGYAHAHAHAHSPDHEKKVPMTKATFVTGL